MKKIIFFIYIIIASQISAQEPEELKFYVDPVTSQVFTAYSEGRVLIKGISFQYDSNATTEDKKTDEALKNENIAKMLEKQKSLEEFIKNQKEKEKQALIKPKATKVFAVRGYLQTTYGQITTDNPKDFSLWTDPAISQESSFILRRARLVLKEKVGDYLTIYSQPDLVSEGRNLFQMRDLYGDILINKNPTHRIRVGQSKVPFGFENLQASYQRFTLDRSDAISSSQKNKRDIGVYYYYTPDNVRELYKELSSLRLRASGEYGTFGIGVYNGQGTNNPQRNGNIHKAIKFSYPFKIGDTQIFEAGIYGFKGLFTPNTISDAVKPELFYGEDEAFKDERVGISFVMFPQPFGIQGEWNIGTTPGLNRATKKIENKDLNGGYLQFMYKFHNVLKQNDSITPIVRWQYFDGYSKSELNLPQNKVNEWMMGVEWYMAAEIRFQLEYQFINRYDLMKEIAVDESGNFMNQERFTGQALRGQVQFNF